MFKKIKMKSIFIFLGTLLGIVVFASSCKNPEKSHSITSNENREENLDNRMVNEVYFAGGCFWGTEHFFQQIRGVVSTEVGYANGKTKNPTYEEVISQATGFAETVKVKYDPEVVDLKLLIDLFFKTIDPTSLNQQGNDKGTQYRTGIYAKDAATQKLINEEVERLSKNYSKPIVVETHLLKNFYKAEDYHQDYLNENPGGYCHIDSELFEMARKANPKTQKSVNYKKPNQETLKKKLTAEQYRITQENGTERPFENEYWDETREGIYVDITTGEPLFVSTDKFESDCGWPSFSKPISKNLINEKTDQSMGMVRTEVRSKTGDSHLGHLFDDGPKDKGGMRYCINSASLKFIPKSEMKEKGYGEYLSLLNKK